MSQDFHGDVGQAAAGDINNYGVQIHVRGRMQARALVPAQKQELYELGLKCVELGVSSKEVWRQVFAELSVKQIDNITAEQFQQARSVLQARLDQLLDEDDKRRLIGKILRATTEKDAKAELSNYCDLTFGRTLLSNLKRVELQLVLEFIQGFQVKPLRGEPPTPTGELASGPLTKLPLREFLITYRVNAFWLFMAGIIVDRFWFR